MFGGQRSCLRKTNDKKTQEIDGKINGKSTEKLKEKSTENLMEK